LFVGSSDFNLELEDITGLRAGWDAHFELRAVDSEGQGIARAAIWRDLYRHNDAATTHVSNTQAL
jgi:hypothetical protein